MKIGILTFHCAKNYGAVLQTYALSEWLRSKGYKVDVINYRPDYLLKAYAIWQGWARSGKNLKTKILNNVRVCLLSLVFARKNYRFNRFISRHLSLTPFSEQNMSKYDSIIYGSDQIWNPDITGHEFDKTYFAKKTASKSISYAASCGSLSKIKGKEEEFKSLLSDFDVISVREKDLNEFLKKEGIVSSHVCDPTFLLKREDYEKVIKSRIVNGPYILLFSLFRLNDERLSMVKEFACRKGIRLIQAYGMFGALSNGCYSDLSIEGFLSLFRDANFVLTSSFHGTALSLIFKKEFATLTDSQDVANRMSSLLERIGLSSRLVDFDNIPQVDNLVPIDWDEVDKNIDEYRRLGEDFLESALKML